MWHRTWRIAHAIGASSAIAAAVLGVAGALVMLNSPAHTASFLTDFPVLGGWSIRLDSLTAVFLLVTLLVSGSAAVFATGYLREYAHGRLALWLWPCFNLMVAAIVVVLIANSVLLFLLGWEVLTLASFMLVILEHTRLESRKAGWLYLLASHAGTAFLIAFFAVNSDVATLLSVSAARPWLVLLPLIGFGIKAGVVPLHVWLPEAHPAAPSHVSAVMSGAMVAVGIYGLFRTLGSVEPTYALAMIVILLGAITAVIGAIQALAARRIKQLLAYSTVENSGIMMLGMGASILAASAGHRDIAFLASVSVLAHVIAHGVFKSALFLGAGSIQHATGTGDFDALSGLGRRLPVTSIAVLAASVTAIAAPPGAAFISEFLLYLSAIRFLTVAPAEIAWLAVVLLVSLALSGACAAAAFVKLYGVPFLGRSDDAIAHEDEEWRSARFALLFLAAACLLLGLIPSLLVAPAELAVRQFNEYLPGDVLHNPLAWLTRVNGVLVLVALGTGALLALTRRRFGIRRTRTWNCGFALPVPRAQYTGTSLVEPILRIFQPKWGIPPTDAVTSKSASSRDPFMRGVYRPVSYVIGVGAAKVRRIQHGQLHWYLLYIFAALAGALLIEFWLGR
jgi:formate hydrogenlyase subunit 3/multisubunit Na+/H+ antiporter MnhD subunit